MNHSREKLEMELEMEACQQEQRLWSRGHRSQGKHEWEVAFCSSRASGSVQNSWNSSQQCGVGSSREEFSKSLGIVVSCGAAVNPRGRGLDSLTLNSCSFSSSDIHHPSSFLSKVILLVYHLRYSQCYSRHFKTTNMEVHIGQCDSIFNYLTYLHIA